MSDKRKKKKLFMIIPAVLSAVVVIFAVYALFFDPHRGENRKDVQTMELDETVSTDDAVEDMDYVMKMLRSRHPAWLEEDNSHVKDAEACYEAEKSALVGSGKSEITVLEEWRIISHILNKLGDGHSTVYVNRRDSLYINDFTMFGEYGEPVKINGVDIESVFEDFLAVYQWETIDFARAVFDANIIISENYLKWIGVDTSDGVTFTFDAGGEEKDYHYTFVPIEEVNRPGQNDPDENSYVYYEIDTENGVGIFSLTSCEYTDLYRNTVKEFFEAVKENDIRDVIVDLRYNGGGSSLVGDEFLNYVDIESYYGWPSHVRFGNLLVKNEKPLIKNRRKEPMFSGNIYVLTGPRTFSAAMDFTMYILDNGIGTVVGEASGNLPDSYGDLLTFATPNSGLNFSVSYKRWFRIDETKSGEPLTPDYPCDSGEALDKAYELILESR